MIDATHTVTYNMANGDESFNKEMASDNLKCHVQVKCYFSLVNINNRVCLLHSTDFVTCVRPDQVLSAVQRS